MTAAWRGVLLAAGGLVLLGADRCPETPDPPPGSRKVAVLVAAEMAEPYPSQNNSEFWYDTVLTYCMLRRNGFRDEDIYVLYGQGHDGFADWAIDGVEGNTEATPGALQGSGAATASSDIPVPSFYRPEDYCNLPPGAGTPRNRITDFPMTLADGSLGCRRLDGDGWACQPKLILDCLNTGCDKPAEVFGCLDCQQAAIPALREGDYLVLWWKGHGSRSTPLQGDPHLELGIGFEWSFESGSDQDGRTGHWLSSEDVLAWVPPINSSNQLLIFETCESGCVGYTIPAASRAIILSSCGCEQKSWATGKFLPHGVFSYWAAASLGGSVPPDDWDPPVAPAPGWPVEEAFEYTVQAVEGYQVPVKFDAQGQAPTTVLKNDPP